MKRKTGVVLAASLAVILAAAGLQTSRRHPMAGSLFSWNKTAVSEEGIEAVLTIDEQLPLTQLFQEFPLDMLEEKSEIRQFISRLHSRGIDCYALMGNSAWALEEQAEEVLTQLNLVYDYNQASSAAQRLRGVVLDIEPYLLPQWDTEDRLMLLRQYAEQMTAYYKYAQKLGLEVVICLPYWYYKVFAAPLEQLIGQACDQAAIMNYNRHDEAGQLAKEAEYAQRYHKTLIHIYEFIAPGKHGLESGNTYHDASLDELRQSWTRLQEQFPQDQIYPGYHYLEEVQAFLERQ